MFSVLIGYVRTVCSVTGGSVGYDTESLRGNLKHGDFIAVDRFLQFPFNGTGLVKVHMRTSNKARYTFFVWRGLNKSNEYELVWESPSAAVFHRKGLHTVHVNLRFKAGDYLGWKKIDGDGHIYFSYHSGDKNLCYMDGKSYEKRADKSRLMMNNCVGVTSSIALEIPTPGMWSSKKL